METPMRPELERFIDDQVKSGRFASRTEVLEAGLARLMLDPSPDELDADDLAAIEESERQIAAGQDLDWVSISSDLRRKYLGQ